MARRVLVTGSRSWGDPGAVHRALNDQLEEFGSLTLVHGGCPTGADRHASEWGLGRRNVTIEVFPAWWETQGRAAGPLRNQRMVKAGADVCLAFPLSSSRGTSHCMKLAVKAGIEVINYGHGPKFGTGSPYPE